MTRSNTRDTNLSGSDSDEGLLMLVANAYAAVAECCW